ncbi:protein crossbronx homolog isoform X2 [Venturia canescens]|uniref:protein crossbronx homolog isoform X2 n=1 Tax=Venturia canescens TaxID=32260 RepID=UPI001C9D1B96|nr:protein crossbronx homolog isoform X2 [Venturia canescens]
MSSRGTTSTSKVETDLAEDGLKRQGSFRKLLPASSNGDSQLSMSIKMIDRPNVPQNTKEYIVFLQEYNILSEYNILRTRDLKGIYVIPSAQNSSLWFGVQFIRQGIYQGGVFRFTITLPQNFPDGGCPKVVFQSNVFHPLIHPETGELLSTWGFPEWKKTNRIWQLIQYITKVLTKIDPKMPGINEEASTLYENNMDGFRERAKKCVKESLSQVYNPPLTEDPHYITFSPYNSEIHEPVRQKIYEPETSEEKKKAGFSWVQPGSLQPFSKPEAR